MFAIECLFVNDIIILPKSSEDVLSLSGMLDPRQLFCYSRILYRCKCPVGIDGTYYTILRYTLNHLHDEYIFSWHVYGPKNYVIMEYSILKSTYHQLIDHPQQSYSARQSVSHQKVFHPNDVILFNKWEILHKSPPKAMLEEHRVSRR